MDNSGGGDHHMGMQLGQAAIITILRALAAHPPVANDPLIVNLEASEDEDMDDLPPLEPIVNTTSNDAGPAASADLSLPEAHPLDPAFATFPQQTNPASSMPDLQSVSDSSEEGGGGSDDEDVPMPPLQAIPDDDNDPQWSDEDSDLPPLEPVRASERTAAQSNAPSLSPAVGDRRARVEDDHDEDRDRRHPSQRTNSQQVPQGQANPPPFFAGINTPHATAPPGMIELFQTFMGGANPPRAPGAAANAANSPANTRPNSNVPPRAAPQPHHHHHHHPHVPPIQLTFDMGDGGPVFAAPPGFVDLLFPGMRGAAPEAGNPNPGNPNPGNPTTGNPMQQLLERIAMMGQLFGVPLEEKEDPDRAKTLVKGLEEVPVGLVRRMEKVGGAPGGHVDEATGQVEAPSCAICWDTLLDQDGARWAKKEEGAKDPVQAQTAGAARDDSEQPPTALLSAFTNLNINISAQPLDTATTPHQAADLPTPASEPSVESSNLVPPVGSAADLEDPPTPTIGASATSSSDKTSKAEDEMDPNKIVCLPCAHVFHAACLIPWFSRPRQTTCPTCRFNVDPDNLTFVARPPSMPNGVPGRGPAAAQGAAPSQANPVPTTPASPEPAQDDDRLFEGMSEAEFSTELRNFLDENPDVITEAFEHAANSARGPQPGPPPAAAPGPGPPPNPTPNLPRGFTTIFGGTMPFPPAGAGWGPGAIPLGPGGPQIPQMMMGMFTMPMGAAPPGAAQPRQQPQAAAAPPPGVFGPPRPPAGPAQQQPTGQPQFPPVGVPTNGMFTVDFTLFAQNPFEGNDVRRQTGVFANQIFGGGVGVPPPGGAAAHPPAGAAPPNAAPGGPGRPQFPPFAFGPLPPFQTTGGPRPTGRPRERKTWTPPPAPGPTLRSRVEQREREVGLRCSDTSCGIGPSDEDPFPENSDASMKQFSIRPLPKNMTVATSVCSHTFHPACLVSAERVAGWGGEDKREEEIEVACPSCRAVGCVSREEWEEGVRGLA
ncbi:hypothetical protein HWV62_37117 [Athelia sp. TMB]|nr:hypothetical protein HWV62_37117 [Athelia sp. TMB]